MKEFECKSCRKKWFVAPDMAEDVIGCPFCLKELPKPRVIVVDSFESAVLKVIVDNGIEIVSDRRRFLAYLEDIAFDYRKEIKILSHSCDSKVFSQFYELSTCSPTEANIKIQRIQQYLIEEEGISKEWAKAYANASWALFAIISMLTPRKLLQIVFPRKMRIYY